MPDLLRRVAVLTSLSAAGIALFAPLSTRSALPDAPLPVEPLLDGPSAIRADMAGGSPADRTSTTRFALAVTAATEAAELLAEAAVPTPASAPMEASLHAARPASSRPVEVARPADGDAVSGRATWYCCSAGYRGQAVVALPGALGGHYVTPPADRSVTVCADRCVVLPVVDYCDCHWGTADQKVADLSPEAWAAVTDRPRSAGVVAVTIHGGR